MFAVLPFTEYRVGHGWWWKVVESCSFEVGERSIVQAPRVGILSTTSEGVEPDIGAVRSPGRKNIWMGQSTHWLGDVGCLPIKIHTHNIPQSPIIPS